MHLKEPYEPTSPRYGKERTSDAILAAQAASNKRRRTGEHFLEGFFEPGHHKAPEEELKMQRQANRDLADKVSSVMGP